MTARNLAACELSGVNLGAQIQFGWNFPQSNVRAVIVGELREVYHAFTVDGVILHVLGETDGGHSADEFTIPRNAAIKILKEGYEP